MILHITCLFRMDKRVKELVVHGEQEFSFYSPFQLLQHALKFPNLFVLFLLTF